MTTSDSPSRQTDAAIRQTDSPMGHYECAACGFRASTQTRLLACPHCGATLTNVSVARE